MSEILPRLVLGGLSDARRALRNGTDAAFLCLLPLADAKAEGALPQLFTDQGSTRPFLFQDVRDEASHASRMRSLLPECCDFIEAQREAGTQCIVFCKWGQSRSATVVIAYLMLRHRYSLHRAFWHVRRLRQNAFPNVGFFRMLQDMDKELSGRVSMDETQREYLAINLNKQVVPTNGAFKFVGRKLEALQGKLKDVPKKDAAAACGSQGRGIFEVANGIFVSDEVTASDEISVRTKRISRMLSLVPEQQAKPHWADESIQYLGVSISNDPHQARQSLQQWQRCHDFLSAGELGARTLVFCNHGHSRSTAIVISYLMISKGYTLHHAYWSVRQRHHACFPNVGFFEELKSMELRLRNGNCSMPVSREEYVELQSQSCSAQPLRERVAKGCEATLRAIMACGSTPRPRAMSTANQWLYGPLGINLSGMLSLGDLCLASGFPEVPTHRCLLVAGHPKYYEDQSWEVNLDVYRLKVLTPVPSDGVHQIRVSVRIVLLIINPNNFRIYLADEEDPQNEAKWLELEIHCSPFRDKDINKELMLRVVQDVEQAPCTQAGQVHHHVHHQIRKRQHRKLATWTSMQDFRDRWQEMLESPVDAPIRVWHRYLWEHWCQVRAGQGIGAQGTSAADQAFFQQEILPNMPLREKSSFDDLREFLRRRECQWSRFDLRHSETRYTKHKTLRDSRIDPGEQADIAKFCGGQWGALVDKSFCVGNLRLDFISQLGRGRHGVAYRGVIKNRRDVPAWQEHLEVCVKVFHKSGEHNTWAQEVAAMQRLPGTVRHCIRYIASGRLRIGSSGAHSAASILDLTRMPSQEDPDAIVLTLARGLPLSKALDSRKAGPGGGLSHSDLALWTVVRQILEFSTALWEEKSYHGDMTLDNALWDSSCNELTFIDFGNAGLTETDPWKRTQRSGTMHLLAALRERLEKETGVPSGHDSCLAWLQSLKGEADTSNGRRGSGSRGMAGFISRLPSRWPNSTSMTNLKAALPTTSAPRLTRNETSGSGGSHALTLVELQQSFTSRAPKVILGDDRMSAALARARSFATQTTDVSMGSQVDEAPSRQLSMLPPIGTGSGCSGSFTQGTSSCSNAEVACPASPAASNATSCEGEDTPDGTPGRSLGRSLATPHSAGTLNSALNNLTEAEVIVQV